MAYFNCAGEGFLKRTRGGKVYQAQKATINPNQEKKNTRPYRLMGLKKGIERAFRLIGFTSGASHRAEIVNAMTDASWTERSGSYTGSRRLLIFVQVADSRWAYTSLMNREPKETKPVRLLTKKYFYYWMFLSVGFISKEYMFSNQAVGTLATAQSLG